MITVRDDRGVPLRFPRAPQRIVSVVPSTTDTLFALGCGDRVVGVTRYCVHPAAAVAALPKVGGTKDADVERILALRPDVVLANCEENTRELFDALEPSVPVYAAFPRGVDDAIADLRRLATLLDVDPAPALTPVLEARDRLRPTRAIRTAWLIWRRPWMTINHDTFIHAMLREAGLVNVFADLPARFPEISAVDLKAADPELVLLPSEPFPFAERHADELAELTGIERGRFQLADGEAASWHGARMAFGFDWLSRWTTWQPTSAAP
jgi:ABC-type Fe3+-hydroxamate transport system substrate-binding protein